MKKNLLILAVLFTCQLHAADYYWVGGGGNWSDLNHWRLGSSAGSLPSIVPSSGDNVFFDAASGFTAGNKTVTLNANGFCNNMTWGSVPNNPSFITTSSTFTVQLQGNLELSPTTTYQVIFAFKGASAATLATKGTVLGEFGMEIDKPGGSLTVTDSLVVPAITNTLGTNAVILTSGTLDVSGKKVLVYQFVNNNTNVRTLNMANSNFTAYLAFYFLGSNKTLNAAGSTLRTYYYQVDGGTYNKVTVTSATAANAIIISNSTFSALTFSPAASAIYSDIASGNTVDTLIFNGQGSIGSNNTVGSVLFGMGGSMDGTGNVIRRITCLNTFTVVSGNYTNTVDSLILAPNRISQFGGTFNINKYLYVAGAPCEAFTEINGDSTAGTVNFAAGAVVDISNVILTGVKATGPITPIAVNGIDGEGNAGFTITEPSGTGTTLYWVGGAGDWNNRAHWSTTSGGSGGACVPFKSDNVVFDANSGLTAGGTVTTTSSSFCNDMTWAAAVGNVTFNESATGAFRVYGSLVLRSTVTVNAAIEFRGSSAATLSMNGGGLGAVQFYIYKTGSGSVTLQDNWSNPLAGAGIFFMSGGLNMAGRTVSFYGFISNSNLARNLNISNATIATAARWIYQGANKSIVSTGSHITSDWIFQVNAPGSTYPRVDLNYAGPDVAAYNISGTTFGQLTFTSTSTTSVARIATSNTIRRLEYKGAGFVAAANNIDSLILAGSRNYFFAGTNTVNQYFKAETTTCSGLIEMRGNPTGTLAFGGAAELHIANVYMQNMIATGPLTPIAFNGANAGGNTGWTISSAAGAARYWVGGSGDWNDPNHWSATSGGAPGACVPTVYDDVYFDAGSGFAGAIKTITVNNGNAYCRNIDWTGATNNPIWSKSASWTIEVWGSSIILNPVATFNISPITLKGSSAASLQGTLLGGNFDVTIDKPGSSLTLLNNYSNTLTDFVVTNGVFNASGLALSVSSIDNSGLNNVSGINISDATVTASTLWRYNGSAAAHTLNAANSKITTPTFNAAGLTYNVVNVTGTASTSAVFSSATIDSLTFTNTNTASAAGINGTSNTLNVVDYKGAGSIYGTGNTIDTLVFFPGNTYTLTANTNTTITGEWYGSGTPCKATEIVSSLPNVNATITKTSGDVNFDYIRLRRITAAGAAAPFIARSHSTDLGNNVNWNIAPYDGAAPIDGLGPDRGVVNTDFPIVLRTDGFFGSPSSEYTWNDNSTADTLLVTSTGTYEVSVAFPDGCSVSDQIVVFLSPTLPVTLTGFTTRPADCQTRLDWNVTDAVNFSRFIVEISTEGSSFNEAASIPYTGASHYSWTNPATANQTIYYRLRMIDIDGRFTYSKTISANNTCQEQAIKVYQDLAGNAVQVKLPAGYERAGIRLYNVWGQRMNPQITGAGQSRVVHLDGLPKAAYLLHVINGTDTKTFTVIKP